jgi:hypothetical protein
MNNKLLLESIALDLKRVAIGTQAHSLKMSERFLQEVFKRRKMLVEAELSEPIKSSLNHMEMKLFDKNSTRLAEDALMFSNIFLSFAKQLH